MCSWYACTLHFLPGLCSSLLSQGNLPAPHQHPLSCRAAVDMHIFLFRMLRPAHLLLLGSFLSCPRIKKSQEEAWKVSFPFAVTWELAFFAEGSSVLRHFSSRSLDFTLRSQYSFLPKVTKTAWDRMVQEHPSLGSIPCTY